MLANQTKNVLATGLALLGFCAPCQAIDSASFEFATGNRTQIVRIGAQWDWPNQWRPSGSAHIGGYWDLTAAHWRENQYRNAAGNTRNIVDIGITPIFRVQSGMKTGLYGEAGIGIHYLSELYDNNERHLSSHFQFGSHIGCGYVFRNKVDIGVKVRHISNGGIKKPNDGVNFVAASISYRF
jgi:hypothetical protein